MKTNKQKFLDLLKTEKIKKDVIEAFSAVEQYLFFDPLFESSFYSSESIPIGFGQQSDPALSLAKMIHLLSPTKKWRLLEIGSGSGYSTAILSNLVKEVISVELDERLALRAKERLYESGYSNVRFFAGDGTMSDELSGMFDAIIILAACKKRPMPLIKYLKEGSKMVFPLGPDHQQQIVLLVNKLIEEGENGLFKTSFHDFCIFPPIIGKYGSEIM